MSSERESDENEPKIDGPILKNWRKSKAFVKEYEDTIKEGLLGHNQELEIYQRSEMFRRLELIRDMEKRSCNFSMCRIILLTYWLAVWIYTKFLTEPPDPSRCVFVTTSPNRD